MSTVTIASLQQTIRDFADARDWHQFHTPKNLASALIVEAAELLEPFQWLTPEQSVRLDPGKRDEVEQEMADVLIYLIRLADVLDIDLMQAAERKLAINAAKYPVEKARGIAAKYNNLPE
jgi:dCTP diphosphatase